jgi:hypothetical protein
MTDQLGNMPVRTVVGVDGRTWHIYVVLEGMKFDPKSKHHRRNWLCLETAGERRYISPVPGGWEDWNDDQLRRAVLKSRLDLRG